MASTGLDRDIDELYQLPLDEFTSARNALAKRAGGNDAAGIKALQKPPLAAWAVNQLYWRSRDTYEKLIETAETLRAAHTNVLTGKRADLRSAGKEHEDALEEAIRKTVALLEDAGHAVTDATRQAIATTLRGLPADTPGRLSRVLQPGGFEMLAGIPVKAGAKPAAKAALPAPPPAARKAEEKAAAGPDPKALARAREAAEAASRALKIAEQSSRREEFEAARAAREAEKSARAVTSAEEEVEAAKQALEEARKEAAAAERRRETAARRAAESEEAVEAARARVKEADREVQALTKRR